MTKLKYDMRSQTSDEIRNSISAHKEWPLAMGHVHHM